VFLDLAVGYQFMSFTNSFMNMKGNHKKMWINLHQAHVNIDFWFENKKRGNFQAISSCFRPLYNSSLVQNIKLCEKGLVLLLTGWKKNSLLPVIGFVAFSHLLSAAILAHVPKQINFGRLGFPNQFCESLIFFLCKHFVLLQKTFMAARRVKWKHSTEHTECAVWNHSSTLVMHN